MAFAFVPTELITDTLEGEIEILGEMHAAKRMVAPIFDPDGARLRG